MRLIPCVLLLFAAACGRLNFDDASGRDAAPSDATAEDSGEPDAASLDSCVPRTCASAGANCGTITDGCGSMMSCGSCAPDETCGATAPNSCGVGPCAATTCEAEGVECGDLSDGCSAVLACGSCPDTTPSCVDGACVGSMAIGCVSEPWAFETIAPVSSRGVDVALDEMGTPHVAYLLSRGVGYATRPTPRWVTEVVESLTISDHPRIAVGGGKVHIVYYDGSATDKLVHAVRDRTWTVGSPDAAGDVGWDPSVALIGDVAHIFYYKDSLPGPTAVGDLREAVVDPSSGTMVRDVDVIGIVGRSTSVVAVGDTLHVGYYDVSNLDLRYARIDGTGTLLQTVISAGDVGSQTAITANGGGVYLAYLDRALGELGLAKRVTGSSDWTFDTPIASGVTLVGDVAVDDLGRIHASYATAAGTHYARRDPSGWNTTIVSMTPSSNALVVERDGRAHLVLQQAATTTYAVGCL